MGKIVRIDKGRRIAIEKGVPIPARGAPEMPWAELELTDSFFIPNDFERKDDTPDALHRRMASRAAYMSKRLTDQSRYVVRKTTREGVEGVRVWRMPKSHAQEE